MNQKLLDKYFRDECTELELEQVLRWFETKEGKAFLEDDIEQQKNEAESGSLILHQDVESKKLYNRIKGTTVGKRRQNRWVYLRVASVLLICASIVSILYWKELLTTPKKVDEVVQVVYMTGNDQHKILTFGDGTVVRLNENSKITVPSTFAEEQRLVQLEGEAYFEVARNPESPFIVETDAATVQVLGTKFDVLASDKNERIRVAVSEGKVRLTNRDSESMASVLLTKNHVGILRLSDQQMTVEKTNVRNYLSWINNRLVYTGETLSQVSRQLEHLYNVQIEFESNRLKNLKLTADMEKVELPQVLQAIANTFDISYKQIGEKILWIKGNDRSVVDDLE